MKFTLIFIFSQDRKEVLMINKIKGPYPNCLNGVGGKIEIFDRTIEEAALREVLEETGLRSTDISPLEFLVKETFSDGTELNVFYTTIGSHATVKQMEEEQLEWCDVESLLDVRDKRLAGNGNIPYFLNFILK